MTCTFCKCDFTPKNLRGPKPKYCSRQCADRFYKFVPPREVKCEFCGKVEMVKGSRRFCSADCRLRASYKRKSVPCKCRHCGIDFLAPPGAVLCSDKCRFDDHLRPLAHRREVIRRNWHRKNHIRRARIRGATIVRFDPTSVFIRDGWKCQGCGKQTDQTANYHTARYPTLDHIIPLAKGGEHSMANTQCLCRGCNNKKGDRILAA
jgi:5-methylcytosine-specific restriction endonuclease McrA